MTRDVPMDDWESLQREWREAGGSEASRAAAGKALARARRERLVVPVVEGAIAMAALGVTALALIHAAALLELALGLVVGAAIALLWARRIVLRVREHGADSAGSPQYLSSLRDVRVQQSRLARFVQITLVLEFCFLVPWWVRGNQVHHRTLLSVDSWLTVYVPVVVMLALLLWSIRLGRSARAVLESLDRLGADYPD